MRERPGPSTFFRLAGKIAGERKEDDDGAESEDETAQQSGRLAGVPGLQIDQAHDLIRALRMAMQGNPALKAVPVHFGRQECAGLFRTARLGFRGYCSSHRGTRRSMAYDAILLHNYLRSALCAAHQSHRTIAGMNIGEAIRKARLEQGVTLEKVALAAGTDAANLSRIERGKQGFSPEMIERIAQALKLPVSALYSYAEQQTATYRVEPAGRQAGDGSSAEALLREFDRLDPENRLLALEFVKMLSRLQEGTHKA